TTLLGIQRPANNPLFASYDAEVVDLTDAMTRYIRIDMTGPQANAQYNGLAIGELAFNVEFTAVPEPSTFVLVTCALAGVALRRLSR
ncbi:MAG TPA: PEP-CTERM sorting domain-containing protein, partial [Bryobacteraceae bacterium]|nr:PEP-CTERM sorting domain-containing protein [Bryobacteraceae bacterium]